MVAELALVTLLFLLLLIACVLRADANVQLLLRSKVPKNAFAGKVVWITGASQGLGELLALEFASKGARLLLSSRSREKLEAVRARCASAASVEVLPFDLCGGPEVLQAAVATAEAAYGGAGIDFMVQTVGASQHSAAERTTDDIMRRLFDVNATAPIALAQLLLPAMLKRGSGRFVVVASMAALVPSPGQSVYSAAKSGLVAYFRSLAAEVSARGVGVTVCCPGPIAAAEGAQPRMVFGPTGLVQAASEHAGNKQGGGSSRVPPQRAAKLIAAAAYHGFDEAWIARTPVLPMAYMMQYVPSLGLAILKLVGPGRVAALGEQGGAGARGGSGRGMYDIRKLLLEGFSRRAGSAGGSRGDAKAPKSE